MEPKFWHDRWHKNEIGFHQETGNPHLRAFWASLGLTARHHVFVPLCGKSRDMIWLAEQGHTVLGVELSEIAVRDFFREQALTPKKSSAGPFEVWEIDELRLLCGDFFDLQATDLSDVDGVYDRASLIALPEDMRKGYVRHLLKILPPDAPLLLVTLEYPQETMNGPPFSVHEEEVHALYGARYAVELLKTHDGLAESPRFRDRGLPFMHEKVFHLRPR
ncbi:MAG: thiopurine S-methyltransferase [Gammaproteobacteria bacterium]|nr:thiopurine S-methyltransferase [Gammaproteobacteria bacterium]